MPTIEESMELLFSMMLQARYEVNLILIVCVRVSVCVCVWHSVQDKNIKWKYQVHLK